ncbi:MAG: hypothetical protein IPL61_07560 [Myxococcales bacterium]|nr:hypothetical protein [Myxococcales bacterium]
MLIEPDAHEQRRLLLDTRLDLLRYSYPGFTLLPSRASALVQAGVTWSSALVQAGLTWEL